MRVLPSPCEWYGSARTVDATRATLAAACSVVAVAAVAATQATAHTNSATMATRMRNERCGITKPEAAQRWELLWSSQH